MRKTPVVVLVFASAGLSTAFAEPLTRAESLAALSHLNNDARENAAERLAEVGEAADIKPLLDRALYDLHRGVRDESLDAIARIGGRGAPVEARRALAQAAQTATREDTRRLATRLLQREYSYRLELVDAEIRAEAALKREFEDAHDARCAAEEALAALTVEQASHAAENSTLRAELAAAAGEIATLEQALAARTVEVTLLKAEHAAKVARIAALQSTQTADAARIERLETDLSSAMDTLADLRRELSERLAANVREAELAERTLELTQARAAEADDNDDARTEVHDTAEHAEVAAAPVGDLPAISAATNDASSGQLADPQSAAGSEVDRSAPPVQPESPIDSPSNQPRPDPAGWSPPVRGAPGLITGAATIGCGVVVGITLLLRRLVA